MEIVLDTALERDIDLLIIEEFISSAEFAKIFLQPIGISENYTIEKAIHSKTDAEYGESDIVFILNINGKKTAIHIENKIDAPAMPEQHNRYYKRAQKDVNVGEYDDYFVLLVAPKKYAKTNKEAKKYEQCVFYEQLEEYFFEKCGERNIYKYNLLNKAIAEQSNGYQWEANKYVVDFFSAMHEYQKHNYPSLPLGTVAWWSHIATPLSGARIAFKANKGYCDLQFDNQTKEELYKKVHKVLKSDMHIEQSGKSASVRIDIHPIAFEEGFENHISEVDEALKAMMRLYDLCGEIILAN